MAQFVQSTVPTDSAATENVKHDHDVVDTERTHMMPLVAALIALAFAASGWFFYHQGQRDALLGAASPPASAADDASGGSTTRVASESDNPASAATVAQTASDGKPDIIVTVHPTAAQMQASAAKPKPKTMLAKATRTAKAPPIVAPAPIDRQVALATRPTPIYPIQALRAREQGTVLVLAQVDVDGHVSDARIVQGSGSRILDRAAPTEVRRWKFEPALHDGQPIVANVEVPVSYRLDQ